MNVLFVCVANSGRSVMAERLFGEVAQGRHQARSAGSEPGTAPHPQVVEALEEIGLDAESLEWADLAVSTCSEEACPATPGVQRLNWVFEDPKNLPLEQVRQIRDEIKQNVEHLVAALEPAAPPS